MKLWRNKVMSYIYRIMGRNYCYGVCYNKANFGCLCRHYYDAYPAFKKKNVKRLLGESKKKPMKFEPVHGSNNPVKRWIGNSIFEPIAVWLLKKYHDWGTVYIEEFDLDDKD